jgi:ribosomal protein S18 acetylase RimI-like enzyme
MRAYRIRLVARPGYLPADVRAKLDALDARLFPGDELYPKEGCYWWFATDSEGVVGFAGLKPLSGRDKGSAFLCRAGVLGRAAGAGLQRRLIRTRLRYARAAGLRCVVAYASRHNFASIANLIRCGMRIFSPVHSWGSHGAVYFVLDLRGEP